MSRTKRNKEKMKRELSSEILTLRLKPSELTKLKNIAEADSRPLASFCALVLRQYLIEHDNREVNSHDKNKWLLS